ncbi:hypothetical protein VWS67_002417 [Cronobacter sakazakii]|uniref:hypothetical protein n=1 Tax=Cronobacter sakazakii TaxID=28141 RepID=UPI000622CB50|nr:hypothetical protein [Cronobacter sakazakii]AKE94877.1 hypothetical protein CSK29544_01919 [Cronobacter sakazakii]EIZ2456630.1 hypothetical protein [Cronobacter sakazakii]EIZ9681807.1 hypothetical protein [Cronobacter sakazakii]EIZ9686232.1 hypothetical protein [Cronobacter sakazakii]EIZ9690437.1 hypothetical protein [Cronobacter sakazakii]
MGALRLPTLQGTLVFGMVGALRLPTLQGTLVFGMVGALRLPTLQGRWCSAWWVRCADPPYNRRCDFVGRVSEAHPPNRPKKPPGAYNTLCGPKHS